MCLCVCAGECVSPSRCVFSSTGGKRAAKFQHLKRSFACSEHFEATFALILAKCDEMYPLRMLSTPAQVWCVCVCVWCGECVRVCMRRPSVFKACVLRGAGGKEEERFFVKPLEEHLAPFVFVSLCVCVYQGLQGCSSSLICFLMTSDSGC